MRGIRHELLLTGQHILEAVSHPVEGQPESPDFVWPGRLDPVSEQAGGELLAGRGQAGDRQVPGEPTVGYTQLYGAPGVAGVSILSA